MIRAKELTKMYGALTAVDGLSLEVGAGEIFGFLGPNGAGKTTTIRMLIGLLLPTSGTAEVAGFNVASDPVQVKKRVGYVAETPYLYEKLTAREFLKFIVDLYGMNPAEGALEASRLLHLFELDGKADEIVEGYSHGMRQKLALASALVHEPSVLFLDEPTSGLDPRSARVVKDLLTGLARRGRTIFLSTHILEIAQHMCDRIGIINRGRLIAVGTLKELQRQARAGKASLEEIFMELTGGPEVAELAAYLEQV